MSRFHLTNHAVDRLFERFSHVVASVDPSKDRRSRAQQLFDQAVPDKSVLNDSAFVVRFHEKYGYDVAMHPFVLNEIMWIGIVENTNGKQRCIIATVVDRRNYSTNCAQPRVQHKQAKPNTWEHAYRKNTQDHLDSREFRLKRERINHKLKQQF